MPTGKLNGYALGSVAAGAILMYAGITGKSAIASLYAITSGKSPKDVTQHSPISGQGSTSSSNAPGGMPGSGSVASPTGLQQYAFSLFPQYGWGSDQEQPLVKLWTQESGWRWNATNPSSGAYGIPQSLPASKMASAGSDWQTNPETQIKWGLQYIHDTYGNPAGAWQHEQTNNWY